MGGGREKEDGREGQVWGGAAEGGRGRKKEKGQGREGGKKEDSNGDREGKKDSHWPPRVHTHAVSLSLFRLAGLDFRVYSQNTLRPH